MNRIKLLLIWQLCLLASAYAGIRMFYLIWRNPRKAWVMAVSHDQLANAAFNGDPDKTISHRANEARKRGKLWGCKLCSILDWLEEDHCSKASGV